MPAVVASEPVAEPVPRRPPPPPPPQPRRRRIAGGARGVATVTAAPVVTEEPKEDRLSRASLRWSGAALRGAVQAVEKCSGNRAASGVKDFLQMHENRALGPRRTSHHFLLHVLSREEDGCAGCGSGFGPFVFADAAAVLMLVQALAVDQLFGFAGAAAVLMLA
eukprot:g4548.t1